MDPKAALDEAESLIADGDFAEALERLAGYFEWRGKGGFEPYPGADEYAGLARQKCAQVLRGK
jgi:hypothetical protein